MREAIADRVADLTPSTDPVADEPLLVRLEEAPKAGPKSGGDPQLEGGQRVDPFAPLPDRESIPLLVNHLDRPLPLPAHPEHAPIELARPARASTAVMSRRPASRENPSASRTWSRLGMALGLVALIVVAGLAYSYVRPAGRKKATASHREQHRVTLAVDPAEASVQIDHLPAMRDDLFLEEGVAHVLLAAAPGRITRRFTIEAKADLEISVHLGRTLALPSPADPEPSRGELALEYPVNPASRDDINRAFAKLDRYAKCLALLGYVDGDARRGRNSAGPSNSEMSGCIQLVDEANSLAPEMFQLRAAGTAYLQGVQSGQNSGTLHKLLATFRSEFLAVRTSWQMEELARQEKDDGATAAWHMRRVVLAAQAWLRQGRAPAKIAQGLPDRRVQFKEYQRAFLTFVDHSQRAMAQDSGAKDFVSASQELWTLAGGQTGKRPDAATSLAACRRLIAAFNAVIVE